MSSRKKRLWLILALVALSGASRPAAAGVEAVVIRMEEARCVS
jgi:hypothetical protein